MKKPIYKKWWFWLIIVIVVIGVANANGNSDNTAQSTTATEKASVDNKGKAEEKAEPKAEEIKAAKVGQAVEVGKLSITVNKVKKTDKIGDNEFLQKKTDNQFIVLNVSIKNNDSDARTLDSSMFRLKDSKGTEYDPLPDGDMYVNNGDTLFLAQINPHITKKSNIVFEVPKDDSAYVLEADSGVGFKAGESALFEITK
ncbi:DUF4352 domain-containing protein [Paenibacillus sediminis]|uniref:DUF4352 domain-containing protein n=1 Tax=Paenibacillus sediminis TaxID=664909 RepID=A0ABS4GZH6_9BACL|nr:DUF4352 domain-containing protein [Paenibacillus sediminis]MBP1935674.1 hypothetical protein [Paenibacillus sediminis]